MEMDEGAVARGMILTLRLEMRSLISTSVVTLGSKWMLAGRPLCMSYIWILKGCMVRFLSSNL